MNSAPPATESAKPSFHLRDFSVLERLDLSKVYDDPQPLEVELGSGDGSFLANYAKLHSEKNFLGVERLLGRLRKIDKKAVRAGLKNVRVLRIEASYLLEFLLPPQSVQALHIYFPDPWPKRKHRKNRLINQNFTELAAKVLSPNGIVFLRTDDQDYFQQMTQVFSSNPKFESAETPLELQNCVTDFERNFNARGVSTLRAAYQLVEKHRFL